jgi:NADH-quinone oxidoreductase subunit N
MSYLELLVACAPESILTAMALVVLAADSIGLRGESLHLRQQVAGLLAGAGCLAAIGWLLAFQHEPFVWEGVFVADSTAGLLKIFLLVLTLLTLVLSVDAGFTRHVAEYFALLLLATVGMMFLVSSDNLLMVFVSLEFTSLSLYILTAFDKRSSQSTEAAMKYFLFGGMSAAFTLFGMSLLYGLSGSLELSQITTKLQGPNLDLLWLTALAMTIIGFGFKVAAAPFHLWAPDVYQGAPVPSAALVASGSKVAGMFVLAKVLLVGLKGAEGSGAWAGYAPGWMPLVATLAVLSLVVGNLAAIVQSNLRRLLAYSAVAHAGYMLLGVLAGHKTGLAALIYYVITYGLTTVGAFGVVAVLQKAGSGDKLADLAGLSRRAPLLSLCLLVFMLSLAGIPPLAGFTGKFLLFASALNAPGHPLGLLWLVLLALAASAVSLYYYLQVLKQVFVVPQRAGEQPVRPGYLALAALVLVALAVLLLGCAPTWLLDPLGRALATAHW